MVRSTVAHVDLAALQHNFTTIQNFLRQDASRTPPDVIAVVKANAYGHGAERVALALEQAGAAMLACADIEEGVVLRRAGVRVPILVFGALSVSDLDGVFEFGLTPTISSPSAAKAVQAAAAKRAVTIGYHLKIDTGMNRLGFRHDNVGRTLPPVLASPDLRLDAVFTHFASADLPESTLLDTQRERFELAAAVVDGLAKTRVRRHASNSASNPLRRSPSAPMKIATGDATPSPRARRASVRASSVTALNSCGSTP